MKHIKLLLIVALMGGLLYVIFVVIPKIIDENNTSSVGKSTNFEAELKKKVDTAWADVNGWNPQTYTETIAEINAYKSELSSTAYNGVVENANATALLKLIGFANALFAKPSCSPKDITTLEQYINFFLKEKDADYTEHKQIVRIRSTISLYKSIIAFGNRSFGLAPHFDKHNGSWNSFDAYASTVRSQRSSLMSNSNYKTVANCTAIKNALSEVALNGKLAKAKSSYRSGLARQIIQAYNSIEYPSPIQKSQVIAVIDRFINTFGEDQALYNFKKEFKSRKDFSHTNNY